MYPTQRRADELVVGDFLLVEDEDNPTRVLEVELVDGRVHLLLWTGTAEGRWLGPRTITLDPDAACTVVGHWPPPTGP